MFTHFNISKLIQLAFLLWHAMVLKLFPSCEMSWELCNTYDLPCHMYIKCQSQFLPVERPIISLYKYPFIELVNILSIHI